jgi:hypothetical protein
MAAKNTKTPPARMNPNIPHNGKFVGVSTKENFRRPIPKTYSYRYEVTGDAGPAGEPLVRAGAAIIESRYRGRGATWNVARSVTEPQTYLVRGGYVHPLEDNPMAYPPRAVVSPEAVAPKTRTPGFAAPSASNKVVRAPRAVPEPVPTPAPTTRFESPAPSQVPGAAAIRRAARPTPANESAYKKTG